MNVYVNIAQIPHKCVLSVHTFGGEIPRVPSTIIKNTCLIVFRLLSLQFWLFMASPTRNSFPSFIDVGLKPTDMEGQCLALGLLVTYPHTKSPHTSCLMVFFALGPVCKACGENRQVRSGRGEDGNLSHWRVFLTASRELMPEAAPGGEDLAKGRAD